MLTAPALPVLHAARAGPFIPTMMKMEPLSNINESASFSDVPFKALLLAVAVGYGTNFPVGRMMNEALPAAATTSGRFTLAAIALSPFIPRLDKRLIVPALLTGVCDAVGYCAQSLALVDTPAAKVSFLGALTVVWVPCLSFLFKDGKRLGLASAPQVWLAALLTLIGIGFLELGGASLQEVLAIAPGDAWSVVQAIGFGTSFYLIGALIGDADSDGSQVLPLTAVNLATVAAFAAVWAIADGYSLGPLAASPSAGWMLDESTRAASTLPGVIVTPIGAAFVWTGLVSTALVRVAETYGLSRVAQADAAVIIATEPLWASVFGLLLLNEGLGLTDAIGGALVICACLVSSTDPEAVRTVLPMLPRGADDDRMDVE